MEYEVTIGIPVYNVEKHIRLSLDSALAQTFQSIEFLVLDDCGTDGSIDIVREYQQTHTRGKDIRIVRQPKNMGIGAGRNRMMSEARGRYFYFLDADDEITPQAIEHLHAIAQKTDADVVYGSYERVEDFDGQITAKAFPYKDRQFLGKNEFADFAFSKYDAIQVPVWNILLKTSFLRSNNIQFCHVNFWEDFAVTITLPLYVDKAVMLSEVTYRYYCRYGSLSNFQKRDHIDKSEVQAIVNVMGQIKQNIEPVRQKPYFPKWLYKVMLTHFYMVCSVLRQKEILQPAFTNRELRDIMRSPLTLGETMRLGCWRFQNLFMCLLGVLPPRLSVEIIKLTGKMKHLIPLRA